MREHEEHTRQVSADPPPCLRIEAQDALDDGRILVGSFEGEGAPEPYVIGGALYPYYGQRGGDSMPKEAPALGTIVDRFGFHPALPDQLGEPVAYDARDMSFEMVTLPSGGMALLMWNGKDGHVLEVGKPGDAIDTALIRAAVCVHVLDNLAGRSHSSVLPYEEDTEPLARQRLQHVLRWHLKGARMRPLFA